MTCAGCDPADCPSDHWHLHVTVQPHWSWTLDDVSSALRRDIERHGIRPVVVTNHFRAPGRPSYRELIPTKHLRGTEAEASREIFRMGVLLNNAGWRVRRLKIEGDPSRIREGRALYYETHLKNIAESIDAPLSTNVRGERIYTLREPTASLVYEHAILLLGRYTTELPLPLRIEAAVLDTAPEMDEEWINQ